MDSRTSTSGSAVQRPFGRSRIGAWVLWVLVAAGVLAFGSVYPWAYTPLLTAAAVVGVYGFATGEAIDRQKVRPVGVALGLAALVVVLQVVPLPAAMLARVSPATDAFLRHYELGYAMRLAAGEPVWHSLSILPDLTWRGLAMFVALIVFLLGTTALVPRIRLGLFVRAVVGLGVALAVFGLAQRALFNAKIYWVWTPQSDAANVFGPFVNRNHFAGWLLMAVSLTGGYLCALLARAGGGADTWRRRMAWLSSPDASELFFAGFAFAVMALTIVCTLSRSGIASLAALVLLLGAGSLAGFKGGRRIAGVALVLITLGGAVAWKGLGTVMWWFGKTDSVAWRVHLWRDTVPIIRDFWRTGTGLDTYGVSTLVYHMTDTSTHPNEAHNDYIQILSEGGVVLAVAAAIVVGTLALGIRRAFAEPQPISIRWIRTGAVVGMIAIAIQEVADFSLQMPGNALLFAVLAAIALHHPRESTRGGRGTARDRDARGSLEGRHA
jgi:O-antigen ligase